MKFYDNLLAFSCNIGKRVIKITNYFANKLFGKPQDNNDYLDYNGLFENDQRKIAGDFFKIGKDMYSALNKYEEKQGF